MKSAHQILRERLTPILGAVEARNTTNVAAAIEQLLGDSQIARLEDHQIIPALATVLGSVMRGANLVKARRMELVNVDGILQSLYPGDDVILAIVKAAAEPEPETEPQQAPMSLAHFVAGLGLDDDDPVKH